MHFIHSLVFSVLIVGELNFTGPEFLQTFGRNGYDPQFPFTNVSELFNSTDLVVAHLEGPISSEAWSPTTTNKIWKFRQLPIFAAGMSEVGIDVALLANNHIADTGDTGIQATIQYLDEQGILHANNPREEPLKIKVAADYGIEIWNVDITSPPGEHPWAISSNEFLKILEKRRYTEIPVENMRIAIVNAHGLGRSHLRDFAARAIKLGMAWVIFNGEHESGDIEALGSGKVVYGLGNFVFGCECSTVQSGKILRLELQDKMVTKVEEIPIIVGTAANGFKVNIKQSVTP